MTHTHNTHIHTIGKYFCMLQIKIEFDMDK
jgi:hypothetical protein